MIAGLSATATVYFDKSSRRNRRGEQRPTSPTHPLPTGERVIVTIGVMMAVLLQVLDTTIANVALPHMQASLSATQDTHQLGADQLYRRLGDRAADQRLAGRPGRAQAAAADLGRRLHRRLGAVRDRRPR